MCTSVDKRKKKTISDKKKSSLVKGEEKLRKVLRKKVIFYIFKSCKKLRKLKIKEDVL